MKYLLYGDVHGEARNAGLVMSRDRRSNDIKLRRRGDSVSAQEWCGLSLEEALAIIRLNGGRPA